MDIPEPKPGLVIRYSYLWEHEAAKGMVEGTKDRPAMVVVLLNNGQEVVVVPLTTKAPLDASLAIEVPERVRRHLGLGVEPCWISTTCINHFVWPGPDLCAVPGINPTTCAYGFMPEKLLTAAKTLVIKQLLEKTPNFRIVRSNS